MEAEPTAVERITGKLAATHCQQGHLLKEGKRCPPCDSERKIANRNSARRRSRRKKRAIEVLGGACRDCGGAFPGRPEVFDFDHLHGKVRNVGGMLPNAAWSTILSELEKCELVCANCHRTRTKERERYNGCTLQ